MKKCIKCGVEKLESDFRINRGHVRGECRECAAEIRKQHYYQNPEKYAAIARKWCKEHPKQRNATKKAWRLKNPEKQKAIARRAMYGIEPKDFLSLIEKQNNKCAVCQIVFNEVSRIDTPHVDHCHKTGRVRGLLCSNCNSGIGKLKDNFSLLIRAASYIRLSSLTPSTNTTTNQ